MQKGAHRINSERCKATSLELQSVKKPCFLATARSCTGLTKDIKRPEINDQSNAGVGYRYLSFMIVYVEQHRATVPEELTLILSFEAVFCH